MAVAALIALPASSLAQVYGREVRSPQTCPGGVVTGFDTDGRVICGIGSADPTVVMLLTGTQTAAGVKRFSDDLIVYDSSISTPSATENGGPLLVWRNPTTTAAGEAGAAYFNVSSSHVATPAADDLVAVTIRVTNEGMASKNLWVSDMLLQQFTTAVPGASGIYLHTLELELMNGCEGTECQTDPHGDAAPNKIRPNGLELVGHSGSGKRNAGALMTWANDTTGDLWWTVGASFSRVSGTGIEFRKLAGDAIDPFTTALMDASSLNRGTEVLLQARSSNFSQYAIRNGVDFGVALLVDSGDGSPSQTASYKLADNQVIKWSMLKNNGNDLFIWEGDPDTGGNARMQFGATETTLGGHLLFDDENSAGIPTVNTGCGTGPTIAGNDALVSVTMGSTPGTSCVLNFRQSFSSAPRCFCTNHTTGVVCRATGAVGTVTMTGTFLLNDVVTTLCLGQL